MLPNTNDMFQTPNFQQAWFRQYDTVKPLFYAENQKSSWKMDGPC